MKRLLLLFTLLLAINILAANEPAGVKVNFNGNNYTIEYRLPAYNFTSITKEGEQFSKISVDGYGVMAESGLPELPQITFNLVIPNNALNSELSYTIDDINYSQQNLDKKIFPFQASWSKSNPLSKRPFNYNKSYYLTEGSQDQQIIKISEPFIIGGVKGVMVTIYPFNYNPVRNILKTVNTGKFTINLHGTVNENNDLSQSYNDYLKEIFLAYSPANSSKGMNYLIITAPEYETTLAQFVNFKMAGGYNVALFTTAATGTSTTAIKTFIQNRYNDPSLKPEYILLVGDVAKIPCWVGTGEGTPDTDLNYGLLAGTDHFADAFVGRFSATSTTELQNMINKTIYMTNSIGSLPKNNVFMASTDNSSITEATHEYVINTYFAPNNYNNLKLYTVTYNATTQQLIDALNANKQFAIYSGHGGETSWADGPELSQAQVRALTNTSSYPFVYSFACVTGSYEMGECFGETWLRIANGASSFYGSSVNSYWDEDDILEKNLIKAMFDDELTKVTPMMDKGKVYLVNHFGSLTATMKRYLEMYNLMGDPSLPTKRQITPDTTPPQAVADLSVDTPTSNSLKLNWTAPYDSTYGGIMSYDIRYSTSVIANDNDFNNATSIIYSGNSDSAGTAKSYIVSGLSFNINYYFAVKARDLWVNTSPISNVVNLLTFGAPVLTVSPSSISGQLQPDVTEYDTLTIANTSVNNSTLEYSVELKNNTFPSSAIVSTVLIPVANVTEQNHLNKEFAAKFGTAFGQSLKGSGGPDNFGYEWIDSDAPGGPQYVWNDISTTGTLASNWIASSTFSALDEGYVGPVNLGFDFKFYGSLNSQIYIHSDGYITVGAQSATTYSNTSIPTSGTPNGIIAPIWDDLEGKTNSKVYYKNDGGKFIVQFTDWTRYGTSATGVFTFQVVLFQNGKIVIYYKTMTGSVDQCTVGIENMDGTDGLQVVKDAAYLKGNFALQFMAEPDWMFMNNSAGMLYNGNSTIVQLKFQTEGLQQGNYGMDVEITSNDPNASVVTVPVSMQVGTTVPVELIGFTANLNNGYISLAWTTATETNNQGYEIQRRISDEWEKVGFVTGKGTTTEKSNYNYQDNLTNVKSDKVLYRLKQIDFDGTSHFSPVVEVSYLPQQYSLEQNYPNPFNPSTTIKFAIPTASNVKLLVYNSLGQLVSEVVNQRFDAGFYSYSFNASSLSSGVYYYRIEADNFTSIKKMMLIK
ncbi:MAG: C25 family cysteine peptidase [bacterium]